MTARPECLECPWTGDYGNEICAPSEQKLLHEVFSGHLVEMVDAPEPEMCCDPDYDPARGGYIHADSCQGVEQ